MTKETYIKMISELLRDCADIDLIELIYKILLQESGDQPAEVV